MSYKIGINCDMGESFGKYKKGNDTEVMPYITTANIAAGFHAGDPHVIKKTIQLASENNVDIGVHPGLPDKLGFGRRKIDATPSEVRDYVVYQLGALRAFAEANDETVTHVKPHGALYTMLSESPEHARAVIEAILDVDESLIYLATDMNLYEIAQEYPIKAVFEGYVDLDYRDDRSVVIPKNKTSRDPELVADRFVQIATQGTVESPTGTELEIPADTICIHGDTPNVSEILNEIHDRIRETSIELVPLENMI